MNDKLKIVLMGTSEFAVPYLKALHNSDDDLVLVVTQPDRPSGRGYQFQASPIKTEAIKLGYQVSQPDKLSEEGFLNKLALLDVDLICVVAYGSFLPSIVLNMPKIACLNVHPSLLPKYRGAAPIQRAIINGDKITGITTMHMSEGMDSGDIISQCAVEIGPNETAGQLHDRLAKLGANLLLSTIEQLKTSTAPRIPQKEEEATFAPKIHTREGKIDWTHSAKDIHNLIRGLTPKPGAYFFYNQRRVKIKESFLDKGSNGAEPGVVHKVEEDSIFVNTGQGLLRITSLQPENSRVMTPKEFSNGYRLEVGARFN